MALATRTPLGARYNPTGYRYSNTPTSPSAPLRANYNPTMTDPAMAQASSYGPYKPPVTAPAAAPAPPSSQSSQAAAAAGAGGGAAAAGGSAPPGEGIYAQDSAAAYDAYNAAVAASEKDSAAAKAQYGFNAQGSNLDPYNSTGLMQQLMHQQSQTSMADRESALGSGLGTTGLGAQIGEQHDFQNQADLAGATNSYQALLAQALAGKQNAGSTLTNALLAARQRQIEADIQNQMFSAWLAGQGGGGGGGDGGPAGQGGDSTSGADAPIVYVNPKTGKTTTSKPAKTLGTNWAY